MKMEYVIPRQAIDSLQKYQIKDRFLTPTRGSAELRLVAILLGNEGGVPLLGL